MIADISNWLRVSAALLVLLIATRSDIRTRTAENHLWLGLGFYGVLFLIVDVFDWALDGVHLLRSTSPIVFSGAFASVVLAWPLAWVFWRLRLMGGADAKALMALAVLFPSYPYLVEWLPLGPVPRVGFFAVMVLGNALLLALPLVLMMVAWNIRVMNPVSWRWLYSLGVFPDERPHFHHWREARDSPDPSGAVWLSPDLPFLLFLLMGLVVALVWGDLAWSLFRR